MMKHVIVTLTGPSASGKTVLSHLLEKMGGRLMVSTTTRPPRRGEVEGLDYHFVSAEQFAEKEKNKELMESAYHDGNWYGTSLESIDSTLPPGQFMVKVTEPQGAESIASFCRENGWGAVRVFVTNPLPVLLERMLGRFLDDCAGLDTETSQGVQEVEKKKRSYASRIQKVSIFEQESWVRPALEKQGLYDLVFPAFEEEDKDRVLGLIQEKVNQQQKHEVHTTSRAKKP